MHVQTLASGSQGNATLVRAGELHLLVDAGLPITELEDRLEAARVSPRRIDAIAITHGHLDHSRSAGSLARKSGARVVCAESLMRQRSVKRARRLARLPIDGELDLSVTGGAELDEVLTLAAVRIPHDADPTVALRVTHRERRLVVVTDMGRVSRPVAERLRDPHVLVLEFNHDLALLQRGPYAEKLKQRVAGPQGHLSNDEAAEMLALLAGPALHTLVLAHLSATNNTPELALEAARRTLAALGREDVRVLVAAQDTVGPNLSV